MICNPCAVAGDMQPVFAFTVQQLKRDLHKQCKGRHLVLLPTQGQQ